MTSARDVALASLLAVEQSDAYLNLILPKRISEARLLHSDAAFATELAYGTSRNQGFYDYVIQVVTKRSTRDIDLEVLCALRLGIHQLLQLETPAHAAIFETVNQIKRSPKHSAFGFVNAALRRVSETDFEFWVRELEDEDFNSDEFLSTRYSHPIWVTRALKLALDADGAKEELVQALASDNSNPKVNLVRFPGRGEPSSSLLKGDASPYGYELVSGDPSTLPEVACGDYRVQDQGSQLSALALTEAKPIKKGERWLDLCSGPGGKAALLAAVGSMHDVQLVTNEVSKHRAKLVETALRHSGLRAEQHSLDGRNIDSLGMFDRIMLDAPCTGLGALRRRPESRWRKNPEDLKELTVLQRELLESAWKALLPGGVLAYVTCSPHPSETTSQIEWFLRHQDRAELVDANSIVKSISPDLKLNLDRKTCQLWPHRNGTDAMFISLIRKASD
jgi:16S rRNA (cytosine967-C5)-methyltransferase